MKLAIKLLLIFVFIYFTSNVYAQEPNPMPGKQIETSFQSNDSADVPYLLYLPEDYQATGDKKFPLVFFLHGRGESKGPLSLVAKWGPPMMAARGDDLPFVIVSPQCPADDKWSSQTQQTRLAELLDDVVKKYNIDESRIFLTGLSMGGYGTWALAANHPERFAAVAPVCGGGDPGDAEKLKDVPIWAFHGSEDRVIPIAKSEEMVKAIRAAGGTKIRFTSLEHLGHNSWSPAYATPELYSWMEAQAKKKYGVENEP